MFSHMGKAWNRSVTRESWKAFVRSVDQNPVIGMCTLMVFTAIAFPNIVPGLR